MHNIRFIPENFGHCISALSVPQDWGRQFMHIEKLRNLGLTGKGVKVAIIDTGKYNHPDIDPPFAFHNFTTDNNENDNNGHSTHIAGIIAGRDDGIGVSGIAPGSSVLIAKALNDAGTCPMDCKWLINAIRWCDRMDVDIINMSLGSELELPEEFHKVIIRSNSIIIAASGNEGSSKINYPANWNGVISVGSCENTGECASYSNYGDNLTVVAPGSDIYSTWLGGTYKLESGTSMAAPMISGILALLIEHHRNNHEVINRNHAVETIKTLVDTETKIIDLNKFEGE